MGIYEKYAQVYDKSGQMVFSLRMIPYLDDLMRRHGIEVNRFLDLACGTGTVALAFAQRGWGVIGIDGSEAMLAEARRKAEESGTTLHLSRQDMRDFSVSHPVDLVTCLYDTLNYLLTIADLRAMARCVAAALKPGGYFLFDMNTEWALANIWDNETYYLEDEGLSLIFRNKYDALQKQVSVTLIGFVRRGELYEKFEEVHVERAYEPSKIEEILRDAGLRLVAQYDCFTFDPPRSDSSRIMWVTRKEQQQGAG